MPSNGAMILLNTSEEEEDIRAIIREDKVSETHTCQVNLRNHVKIIFESFRTTKFFRLLVVIGGERDVVKWICDNFEKKDQLRPNNNL